MRSNERHPAASFAQRLQNDGRNKLVVSDFDQTLCHQYEFDAATNNHHAVIDPKLATTAGRLPLIIATATRAMHPKIVQIRESGMVGKHGLLIAENGGVILEQNGDIWWSVEQDEAAVNALHQQVTHELPRSFGMPESMELVAKRGLTSLIVRMQCQDGKHDPGVQAALQEALQTMAGSEWTVVDGGRSLTVQRPGVSKLNALEHTGLKRSDHCLIGMGDGHNDVDLLQAADIAIAVGERIATHADFVIEPNIAEVTNVLRTIGRAATSFRGWSRYDAEEEARCMRDKAWY